MINKLEQHLTIELASSIEPDIYEVFLNFEHVFSKNYESNYSGEEFLLCNKSNTTYAQLNVFMGIINSNIQHVIPFNK